MILILPLPLTRMIKLTESPHWARPCLWLISSSQQPHEVRTLIIPISETFNYSLTRTQRSQNVSPRCGGARVRILVYSGDTSP